MLLKQTLLYMPAQIVGPLFQLIAMIVWTHIVNDHTLGVITLVTATHELLQIGLLAWWSQFVLRFFGRFDIDGTASGFYPTENVVLLVSVVLQSLLMIAMLRWVIAPDAGAALMTTAVCYVITRSFNLYIAERARVRQQIGIYSVQQIVGPAAGFIIGVVLIKWLGQRPEWPLAGYAIAQLIATIVVLPKLDFSFRLQPIDRGIIRHALQYGLPLIIGGGLGWIGLNASRFIVNDMLGVAAAGLFAVGYGLGQRAAAVAAMLVTAAAFPLAVKRMEESGSKAAMEQLTQNSALLIAILAPSIVGIFMLRTEIVTLLIAIPFQQATLAVLPLSVLAGAIRNLRAHFGDQVFLLHSRTRMMVAISSIDAITTIVAGIVCVSFWGVVGGAIATVVAAAAAAAASFAIGFRAFGLTLPVNHLLRILFATTAMTFGLQSIPQATSYTMLAAHITFGAAIYGIILALLYAPMLSRMLRHRLSQFNA
ncbi:MAG: lipopolysaccharide biosynthesis protein [Xanthobacteraceae bacterium]